MPGGDKAPGIVVLNVRIVRVEHVFLQPGSCRERGKRSCNPNFTESFCDVDPGCSRVCKNGPMLLQPPKDLLFIRHDRLLS